jgi:hypothetical protein
VLGCRGRRRLQVFRLQIRQIVGPVVDQGRGQRRGGGVRSVRCRRVLAMAACTVVAGRRAGGPGACGRPLCVPCVAEVPGVDEAFVLFVGSAALFGAPELAASGPFGSPWVVAAREGGAPSSYGAPRAFSVRRASSEAAGGFGSGAITEVGSSDSSAGRCSLWTRNTPAAGRRRAGIAKRRSARMPGRYPARTPGAKFAGRSRKPPSSEEAKSSPRARPPGANGSPN